MKPIGYRKETSVGMNNSDVDGSTFVYDLSRLLFPVTHFLSDRRTIGLTLRDFLECASRFGLLRPCIFDDFGSLVDTKLARTEQLEFRRRR